jgi:hypothetical protein
MISWVSNLAGPLPGALKVFWGLVKLVEALGLHLLKKPPNLSIPSSWLPLSLHLLSLFLASY